MADDFLQSASRCCNVLKQVLGRQLSFLVQAREALFRSLSGVFSHMLFINL